MATIRAMSRRVLNAAVMLNKMTQKQLHITVSGDGVNVNLRVRKKNRQSTLTWTTAGEPRLRGKPIGLTDTTLTEYSFTSLADRKQFKAALTEALKKKQVSKLPDMYLINTTWDDFISQVPKIAKRKE